ncbi:glycosyltransferase [Deinococcus aquiradiocola]|uniref:Glycosyl transferase n=1 Tax=Deinococcus aquiradiocola TaxID=393059 RepID=A0A917PMW8_9DEIO|nr:glycosyltransferase [Deinococcus aquiradiocola]GGJ84291.1 glycosyl transferase [Deinococcus aquiradiocola]
MRSLRIGLLTDVFLPDPNGVSTSVLLLQRELRRRGHRAVIVAPRFPDYLDPETLHGVVRLPSMVNPALPRQRLAFPTRRRLSGQFDLVHTHTPGAIGFWGARLAKRWDIPHISTFHTHLEHYAHYIPGMSTLERHAGVLTRIVRRFYEKADLVVAPTEASRDMLPSYGIYRPSVVLPTGIDESLLQDAPDVASPWPAGKRRLLSIGRLGFEKRHELVFQALARVREQHDAHLVLIGEGPQLEYLREQARGLGLAEHVTFYGPVPLATIGAYYRQAELFLFGSDTETQGLVLAEAQTMGVPVVAVGAEGTLGGVEPGVSGQLVASGDWAALAAHTSALLADPAALATMSAGARQFARRFSSSKMAEQMLDIYLQSLSQQGWRSAGADYGGLLVPDGTYAKANGRNTRKYGLRGF